MSQLPAQIVQGLQLGYPLLYSIVATTTLVVWDTLLTFDEERVFILLSNAGVLVKVLYCMARYIALSLYLVSTFLLVGNHEQFRFCSRIMWLVYFAGRTIIACSNVLLIQRVYAFCGRSKPLLWFLSSTFFLIQISAVVILVVSIPKFLVVDIQENLPAPFGNCVIEQYSRILSISFFLEFGFHIIAFTCITIRVATLRSTSWRTGVRVPSLYMEFLRDGIWVFVFLSMIFLLSGVYLHTERPEGLSFAAWSYVAFSISCTRLILNLNYSVNRSRNFSISDSSNSY